MLCRSSNGRPAWCDPYATTPKHLDSKLYTHVFYAFAKVTTSIADILSASILWYWHASGTVPLLALAPYGIQHPHVHDRYHSKEGASHACCSIMGCRGLLVSKSVVNSNDVMLCELLLWFYPWCCCDITLLDRCLQHLRSLMWSKMKQTLSRKFQQGLQNSSPLAAGASHVVT